MAEIDLPNVAEFSKKELLSFEKEMTGIYFSGHPMEEYEEKAKKILLEDEIVLDIEMNQGDFSATAWGCDLTYDYVKINGDYRT